MDGKHKCPYFTAELSIQLHGRHHRPFSWLSGYPICTRIRHQRCRIRKSGFMTAYCPNLLINLHWKGEIYSSTIRIFVPRVSVLVALYAGNWCNRASGKKGMTFVSMHTNHPALVSGLFFDQHLFQNYFYLKLYQKNICFQLNFTPLSYKEPTHCCSAIIFRLSPLDKVYHNIMYM